MKLVYLQCGRSRVADLTPLKGMNLSRLGCYDTPVADLTPLKGMKLISLDCSHTRVSDLAPLAEARANAFPFDGADLLVNEAAIICDGELEHVAFDEF